MPTEDQYATLRTSAGVVTALGVRDAERGTVAYTLTGGRLSGVITLAPATWSQVDPFASHYHHVSAYALLGRDTASRDPHGADRADLPVVNGIVVSGELPLVPHRQWPTRVQDVNVFRAQGAGRAPWRTSERVKEVCEFLLTLWRARNDTAALTTAAARVNLDRWRVAVERRFHRAEEELTQAQRNCDRAAAHLAALDAVANGELFPSDPASLEEPS